MTRAILLGAAALLAFFAVTGCDIGPTKDRLYLNEWKGKKDRPINYDKDWVYQGEHWEHAAPPAE